MLSLQLFRDRALSGPPASSALASAADGTADYVRPIGHSRIRLMSCQLDSLYGRLWRKADPHVRCQRPLSVLARGLTQGVRLCLTQSLRDACDQIGRVFD